MPIGRFPFKKQQNNTLVILFAIVLIIIGVLFLVQIEEARAATYYVDADAADGGDGTTTATSGPNAAWNQLSDITGLVAGDSVLLHRADTWTARWNIPTSGSAGAEITYGAYGEGDRPIVNGTGQSVAIAALSKSYIIIRDIAVTGANSYGLWVANTNNVTIINVYAYSNGVDGIRLDASSSNLSNITLENCESSNNTANGFAVSPSAGYSANNISFTSCIADTNGTKGFYLVATVETALFEVITFDSCTGTNNGTDGVGIITTSSATAQNITLADSTFSTNSNNGLTISATTGSSIADVTVNRNTASNNNNDGFSVNGSATNITFNNCKSTDNGLDGIGTDGDGITMHGDSTGTVRYCWSEDNWKSGIGSIATGSWTIHNNIIVYRDRSPTWAGIPAPNANVYNNIIYNSSTNGTGLQVYTDGPLITSRNNIIYGFSIGMQNAGTTLDTDYDLVYGATTSYSSTGNGVTEGANSLDNDPLFANSDSNDFSLQSESPAIDAGVDVNLSTDYAGNPIYGPPDIGAYEYQPPYTIGTDKVDITSPIRIYADGKYRYTSEVSGGTEAGFSVSPSGGWPEDDYSQYMDIAIDTWRTSGDYYKKWTETASGSLSVSHTVGDLKTNTYYTVKVDETRYDTYLSNSSGEISFTYTGTYSDHEFEVEEDNTPPENVGISSITADSSSQLTLLALTATDSESGLHQLPYQFKRNSTELGWQASTTLTDSGLSANTQYTYQVKARDANGNESDYSAPVSNRYTLANVPSSLALTANSASQITASWSANSNPSGTEYFIENTTAGTNSGWTTNTSWVSSGLSCERSYSFRVKARNGDGVQTDTISISQSTDSCGGGVPGTWYRPPSPPAPSPENPQGGFRIIINAGDKTTNSRFVTLKLFAGSDTARMAISNNPDFAGIGSTGQIAYQSLYSWDICKGQKECPDGNYTVHARFYSEYGQSSPVVSDSIILKGIRPEVSVQQMTLEEVKAKIMEIQRKLIKLITQLIQLL